MKRCIRCGEELTPKDEAEHERRAEAAADWGNAIFQNPDLCTGCLSLAQDGRGAAAVAAAAVNSTSPWNVSYTEPGEP